MRGSHAHDVVAIERVEHERRRIHRSNVV
jgi:hypothetical protein